jgi:hypothetical protein
MDIVFLDLPAVPHDIGSLLIDCASKMHSDPDSVRWLNDFHNHQINSAEMIYGNKYTVIGMEIIDAILEIYRPYLGNILPIVGRIRSVAEQPAITPPHCDRGRHVALNYILTAGGDSVETIFYSEHRSTASIETAHNCRFDEVSCAKIYSLPLNQWHAFDAQRYHSVRNITGTRIILSLVLAANPTWEEFLKLSAANCLSTS